MRPRDDTKRIGPGAAKEDDELRAGFEDTEARECLAEDALISLSRPATARPGLDRGGARGETAELLGQAVVGAATSEQHAASHLSVA